MNHALIGPHIYNSLVLLIVWVHWLGDFVFQTDRMAKGKSNSNKILGLHVGVYSLFLLIFGWRYAIINGALHFCIDWVTSRVTRRLYAQGRIHDFFVIIGLDQALHLTCLIITAPFIGWNI